MKKGIKTLAAAALAISALTPVAAAAASSVADGVYTSDKYHTLPEFKKLSTADKSAALTSTGAVVVIGGQAYKATDVLSATDAQLPTLGTPADTYTTAAGNKLVSGQKLDTPTASIGELKVESVSAINAKQILVKFNNNVGTGASTTANYGVTNAVTSFANPVTNAQVQADGKSVLLTLTNGYRVATDVVVAVDNVFLKDSIKDKVERFSTSIKVNDTVAPSITSIESSTSTNAAQVVKVKFSEPIDVTNLNTTGALFKVNGVVATAVAGTNNQEFTLSGLNLPVDKTHTVEVLNFKDAADNDVTYVTKTFSVTKETTNVSGQVKVLQDNKVQVTFDRVMNAASLAKVDILRYDSANREYVPVLLTGQTAAADAYTAASYSLDVTGKIATYNLLATEAAKLFDLNNKSTELVVKVKNGVVDSLGNPVTPFEERVTTTQDETGPVLNEVTFKKNSKGEVETLYFHFNEELAAAVASTEFLDNTDLLITNKDTNLAVANADVFGSLVSADVELATDKKTIIVRPNAATNKLTFGNYEFKFFAGEVTDTAFAANANKETKATVNFGTATNRVVVSNIDLNETGGAVDNVATVTFSKAVTAASAKNPANYKFNGKSLPADTVIQIVSDTQVKFTLPANFIEKTDANAVVSVSGIQPIDSSATFVAYTGTENVLDNTAPVAKGSLLADGTIQFTFTDAGTVTPVAADFKRVKLNGKTVAITGDAGATNPTTLTLATPTLPDGSTVVTIKVVPKVADNLNTSGFTYLYVDVDGDNALDFAKDIVLQSVQATTGPDAWYSNAPTNTNLKPANLNLLTSVEVITDATTATADDSTYNAGSGATNKLKANDTLKVK